MCDFMDYIGSIIFLIFDVFFRNKMYSCCQRFFSSSSEYHHHRHNVHREWVPKPYRCEEHPHNEAGKAEGCRTVLFTTEFRVFKHEMRCIPNQQYLRNVVGEMTSVRVPHPTIKVSKYTIRSIVCEASCHPVTRSLSYSVLVTRSLGHSVTRSLGHLVTRSLNHSSHLVTQSLSHLVTMSFCFNITTN